MIGSTFAGSSSSFGRNLLYSSSSPAKSIYAASTTSAIAFPVSAASVSTLTTLSQSSSVSEYPVGLCAGVFSITTRLCWLSRSPFTVSLNDSQLNFLSAVKSSNVATLLPISPAIVLYGAQCQSEVMILSPGSE